MITRKNTSDLLFASLKDLLKHFSFSKITTDAIVKNCNLSRTTFYRHFKDKYQLASYGYNRFLTKEMKKVKSHNLTLNQSTIDALDYFLQEKIFYKKIINYHGQNSLEEQLRREFIKQTSSYCKRQYHLTTLPKRTEFQIKFVGAAHTYLILNWIKNNYQIPPRKFAHLLISNYPVNFLKI